MNRMTRRITSNAVAATVASTFAVSGAHAQTTIHPSWTNPNARQTTSSNKPNEEFVDDLNKLIDQAERDRAASPQFLRDLRDLARRYDNPWRASLLKDDFSDGDFTQNPVWKVTKGQYRIERNFGLRGFFDSTSTSSSSSSSSSQKADPAAQLLGAILNQALGGGQGGSSSSKTSQNTSLPVAAIHTAKTITNAFSINLELTSWKNEGFLEIGPYQGGNREAGYRLRYHTSKNPSFELLRVSSRGSGIIDTHNAAISLEDKKTHAISWTRDQFGDMTISVDGKQIMKSIDQSFRNVFDGFTLNNHGGDYIISRITINGTK